jgi:hypothetical protein
MKTLEDLTGYIDSRDLIDAIEEWGAVIDDSEATQEEREEARKHKKSLEDFCEPFVGYGDWEYGETLISEDEWVDYVKELLSDCGYIPKDLPDFIEIDWDTTADNVAVDYMRDNGYYMRCV